MRLFLPLAILLPAFALTTVGCPQAPGGVIGDDDDADDDDAVDDDDAAPLSETDCEDGVDNDEDGATDCEDEDCAEVEVCTWPTSIEQRTDVTFEGYEIVCGDFVEFDYQMPDCADRYGSTMVERTTGAVCTECDRTFEGPYTPIVKGGEETCSDLLDQPAPTSGAFGLTFTSPTSWGVWTEDPDTGVWSEVGSADDDGSGTLVFSSGDVLNEAIDTDLIDCRQQDIGFLTVTLQFSPGAE